MGKGGWGVFVVGKGFWGVFVMGKVFGCFCYW